MPVTIDRLGPGTLTFGASPNDFSMQVSRCVLIPDHSEEDGIATLGDPDPIAEVTTSWTLEGDAVSDWAQADGFVNWTFDNNLSEQPFEFVPNNAEAVKWTGTVQIRAMEIGGDVSSVITTAFSFPCKGTPVRGAHTPAAQAAAKATVTK